MQDGVHPLYVSSLLGHAEVVDTLLKNGADPNLTTKVQSTCFSKRYLIILFYGLNNIYFIVLIIYIYVWYNNNYF